MSDAPERALFGSRMGILDLANVAQRCANTGENLDSQSWRARHNASTTVPATYDDDPPPLLRCTCPGSLALTGGRCAQRATQEDRLCDACREHCYIVNPRTRERVQLVALYGMDGPLS